MIRVFRDICYELFKLSNQKKNYIPLAGYLLFVLLCYVAFRASLPTLAEMLYGFDMNSSDAGKYLDGFFFARIVLVPTFIVLMPIVMAALGGDCIAGEIQEGSLKLYMSRPRSRVRVILVKFIAVYGAGILYSLFFSCAGLVIGILLFGLSPAQVLLMPGRVFGSTVTVMTNGEALIRYFSATLYFSFSLMTLGAMALFFSTIFNRMSSAAIAVLTLYFVSYVTAALPFAGIIRPWLISEIMNNAFLFWLSPVPLGKLCINVSILALYIFSFLIASVTRFNYKDIQ